MGESKCLFTSSHIWPSIVKSLESEVRISRYFIYIWDTVCILSPPIFFLFFMKKVFFFSVWLMGTSIFAQDKSIPNFSDITASWSTESLWLTVLGFLFFWFFYIGLPMLLYCISSYSLGLLDKHYHKKSSSRISWVPFARYYYFIKKITKSSKKAFIITLLPWIIAVWSIASLILLGIMEQRLSPNIASSIYTTMTTLAILTLVGTAAIIAMSFWRAFIISKYVKWDTTTALGLSTYTTLVLWYIALDRVYKKTDIIGIVWFSLLGLIICFYVGIFVMQGLDGVAAFLWA